MKLIKSILCCACAVGVMMAATNRVQAGGIVLDNLLYVPIKISAKATLRVDGKTKSLDISEKDIVEAVGLAPTATLAVSTGSGDIFAVSGKTIGVDLTAGGFLTISNNQTGSTTSGTTRTKTGTMAMGIYSNPQFESGVVDASESEAASSDWLELTGDFTLKETEGATKNGVAKLSDSYSAKSLTGNAKVQGIDAGSATGSVSGSGSGTVSVP